LLCVERGCCCFSVFGSRDVLIRGSGLSFACSSLQFGTCQFGRCREGFTSYPLQLEFSFTLYFSGWECARIPLCFRVGCRSITWWWFDNLILLRIQNTAAGKGEFTGEYVTSVWLLCYWYYDMSNKLNHLDRSPRRECFTLDALFKGRLDDSAFAFASIQRVYDLPDTIQLSLPSRSVAQTQL